jgi:hypothetical protein
MQKYTNEYIASDDFLLTNEWKTIRASVMLKYKPKCMCCGKTPFDGVLMNVDHIKPRKTHPELALEFDNLQVLCNPCNKEKGNKHATDYRPTSFDPEYFHVVEMLPPGKFEESKQSALKDEIIDGLFLVTKKWLDKHRTEKGGYTHAQIRGLTGTVIEKNFQWKRAMTGKWITLESKRAFEDGKNVFVKTKDNVRQEGEHKVYIVEAKPEGKPLSKNQLRKQAYKKKVAQKLAAKVKAALKTD